MRPPAVSVLCALLGLAGGAAARWAAAGHHVNSADARHASKVSSGSRAGGNDARGTAKAGPSPPATGVHGTRAGVTEILALRGLGQMERFAEWLSDASTADFREFALAMKAAEIYDTTLSDALFLRWVELDPDDALSYGRESGYTTGVWWAWGKLDPNRALAAAAESKETRDGAEALRGIAQVDPERAEKFMEQYPQFVDRSSLEGMVTGLSLSDPRAAAEIALRMDSSEARDNVKGWAKREPDEAFAWALEIESAGQRSQMLSAIVQQWEDTSPERVGPALEMLPAGKAKNVQMVQHAGRLALTDPAAGVAYARQLALPAVRQAALAAIAQSLARDRPQQALEFIRQQDWKTVDPSSSTGVTNDGVYVALKALGRSMPEEAMTFALTLAQSSEGHSAPRQTFEAWAGTDVAKASSWLAAQPAAQRNPGCVEALVSHLSQSGPDQDFDSAVRWAVTIKNSDTNPWGVRSVFDSWRQADPAAAEQALQLPGVPEQVRTEFLRSKPAP